MNTSIPLIDYQKIADAKVFYESCGFTEIAVPWIVDYEAYGATRPPDRKEFYTLGGYLNASGEQSFIELMLSGVKLGKHLCITPCFREEPVLDEIHHRYFVKLELIDMDATTDSLLKMIEYAMQFLDQYFPGKKPNVVQTDAFGHAFDIVDPLQGIELGSYGIRTYKHFTWIYGTGIALPRLDTVIKQSTICTRTSTT